MAQSQALQQCLAAAKASSPNDTMENLQDQKIDSSVPMVKLQSLFSTKDINDSEPMAAVFAKYDSQVFVVQRSQFMSQNTMVPATTKLMRDESQTLVGISAVSGG